MGPYCNKFLQKIIDKHGATFDEEQWIAVLEMVRSACLVKPESHASDEVLKSGLLRAQIGE